jgi:general L-amino acid transport system substrate-binding protein
MGAKHICASLALAAALAAANGGANAQMLQKVKERGWLLCGVNQGLLGFSAPDRSGNWAGLDVDLCRALAAAIFNDASKVQFVPLDTSARFAALQAGNIDVLSRNSTWTLEREAEFKVHFAAITYYDGQGFLVRDPVVDAPSALELHGKKICVQSGTTTESNLADFFKANKMQYQAVKHTNAADSSRAYDSGACDVLTSDISQLHAERLRMSKPDAHIVLPEIISKEPLGPVVRQGDDQWFSLVKWTHLAMLNAEELGVTSKNIDEALRSSRPEVARLVGTEGNSGERLGLTKDWAARIVRLVGNYGEVFERNLGGESALEIPRGMNQLWNTGGLQYAPPIR